MRDGDSGGARAAGGVDGGAGFLVVGIGASAGGIKALREFFAAVPPDSGIAYVVILHLSPDHDSQLAEVLQSVSAIPVAQVNRPVEVEPDRVYVIPPNRSLAMSDGHLEVADIAGFEERRAPVDIFFRTLADSARARGVCVVLSGTGPNGSMGLKRVKEMGGVAVAQDPSEAEFTDMPRNAIATGLVDFVLPAAEIPARLLAYDRRLRALQPPEAPEPPEPPEPPGAPSEEEVLGSIFTQLRMRTGHDFSGYKRATVLRRIARRISVRELPDLPAYARFLAEHPDETQALLRDLLISVTNFFRDPEAFAALERRVIRQLFDTRRQGDPVRVWVAGCATGEEAYSIAMLLAERAEASASIPEIQIFATDIDRRAVALARDGFYSDSDVADVSPERLRRFFVKEHNGFRVRRELREMILFAVHNLVKDPPFSHIDLVSCRNLLIYFNRHTQDLALDVFHFALRPRGTLFLGSAESAGDAADLYATVDKEHHIYESRPVPARLSLPIPEVPAGVPSQEFPLPARAAAARAQERLTFLELHQRLLEEYGPPSVLVDDKFDVVHLSDAAGRFLHVAGGEPTHNVIRMVRPELRLELHSALLQAVRAATAVVTRDIEVMLADRRAVVRVAVRPVLHDRDDARGFMLVLFEEIDDAGAAAGRDEPVRTEPALQPLEEELTRVRDQLRATIEQYELQHEELRASNEELQAMNEELRSTAEELETSKEELQSVNEELTTVNQELKIKVEELSQANNDFQNLMNSTDIGTLFLDRKLRIKFFTPRARDVFNVIPADRGRSLEDIRTKVVGCDLTAVVGGVLETLLPSERELQTASGHWYLMRISPYRTSEDRIDGVVLSFVDISTRKEAELALVERDEQLALALRSAGAVLWRCDLRSQKIATSPEWREVRAFAEWRDAPGGPETAAEPAVADLLRAVEPADRPRLEAALDAMRRGAETLDVEFRVADRARGTRWVQARGILAPSPGGAPVAWGIATDVTERKAYEERLAASEERLRALIESAKDYAIFTVTPENRVDSWNSGAERVFGYTEAEILGQSAAVLYTPEDRANGVHDEELRRAATAGVALDEREHVRKDGSRFFASGVMRPVTGARGPRFVKIARDLTERKEAEARRVRAQAELEHQFDRRTRELSAANEALSVEVRERAAAEGHARALVGQIVTIQEDERRRIARDLHDHLGQQLTALRLNLEVLRARAGSDPAVAQQVEQSQAMAAELEAQVDFLAWELRPASLDELGLVATLEAYVRGWSEHFGVLANFHSAGLEAWSPSRKAAINLYRIAQEALNNVFKHAAASRVDVILERRGESVALIVEDDGVGFNSEGAAPGRTGESLGLVGMRERAALVGGRLDIETSPGEGTTVFALVPFAGDGEGAQ